MQIVLASSSPRRREILEQLQIPFQIMSHTFDENLCPYTEPVQVVDYLAKQKAYHCLASAQSSCLIIAADTIVAIDGQVLGKPANRQIAMDYLQLLSGRTHQVYTGCSILNTDTGHCHQFNQMANVTFRVLSEEWLRIYCQSDEPLDKAGAYGIQGMAAYFIDAIDGDYHTIVGLPILPLINGLLKQGYSPFV